MDDVIFSSLFDHFETREDNNQKVWTFYSDNMMLSFCINVPAYDVNVETSPNLLHVLEKPLTGYHIETETLYHRAEKGVLLELTSPNGKAILTATWPWVHQPVRSLFMNTSFPSLGGGEKNPHYGAYLHKKSVLAERERISEVLHSTAAMARVDNKDRKM